VQFVTKKDKVHCTGRIEDTDGNDNKILFLWWHGGSCFQNRMIRGAVASTHNQGRLATPIQGDNFHPSWWCLLILWRLMSSRHFLK
jgi:hypothetical protein